MLLAGGWDDVAIFIAGGIISPVVRQVAKWVSEKPKDEFNQAASIREELRQQILDLRKSLEETNQRVEELQGQVDNWRSKYYAVLEANLSLQHQCHELLTQIQKYRPTVPEETHEYQD